MIAQLEGVVVSVRDNSVVLDVHGVGYRVFTPSATAAKLQKEEGQVKLLTHLYLRDNAQELYGFETPEECQMFEMLISVSGIGPKIGLQILSIASVEALQSAIAQEDYSILTKVSGVGEKTARKVVLDLASKMPTLIGEGIDVSAQSDAIDALMALGYSQRQARETLRDVPDDVEGVEERIREALKILGR